LALQFTAIRGKLKAVLSGLSLLTNGESAVDVCVSIRVYGIERHQPNIDVALPKKHMPMKEMMALIKGSH
jgi:hypothetical protein